MLYRAVHPEDEWFGAFSAACDVASAVIAHGAVAERWSQPSALAGLTVGGIVAHVYAAIRRFEVALDEELHPEPRVLTVAEFYGANRVDDPTDLGTGWHPMLREDAERRAERGHGHVVERFEGVVSRLRDRLTDESPDRLISVWTVEDGVTPLRSYVSTRVVELVVHADDIATSADLPPLEPPEIVVTDAIGLFIALARHRSGDLDVIRAFARHERAPSDTLRVL